MTEPLRVAIVGLGWWSGVHAAALKKTDLLKLVTCFTRTREKGTKFARANACDYDLSFESLLKRKDVDAVILTTPHTTHPDLAIRIAEAGKHLLIEKPLANTVVECRRIVDAFREVGLTLSVCHDRRWTALHRKMKELIDAGSIGQTVIAEANYSLASGLTLTPKSWRWYRAESPGGPLAYLGIHMIDTVRFLVGGEVQEVDGLLDKMMTKAEIYDTVICRLRFSNGIHAVITDSFLVPRVSFVNIYGSEASLYGWENTGLTFQKAGAEVATPVQLEKQDPVRAEQEDFASSITERRKPAVDGNEGTANVAVIEAIIKSSNEERRVMIDEVLN